MRNIGRKMIKILEAHNSAQFKIIENLAKEIFHEVYDPIIPAEHTDYFLTEFQTKDAIEKQIKNEGFSYFLLTFDDECVGYIGIQELKTELILSKLYIRKSFRGLKIGKTALEYVQKFATDRAMQKIQLIVNRLNKNTINIYLKNGFEIVESVVNSFPSGHSIEDYKMEKRLNTI